MECIVHFTVGHRAAPKRLRGLIFVKAGEKPDAEQLLRMFEGMGYKVVPDAHDPLLFRPTGNTATYTYIRVNELDVGEERYTEDTNLKMLLNELLPKQRTGL
ncbi:hypothetical protein [Paenibacillus sp. JCM 10914]|uniref:hypothetical protein n=1 Tax=Paenibacillus sp. JCM 10914 TaxID=1236974 RepID=UPI0003CC6F53|nr:hypothetical protein [Paenibacillus sp. JCM 10914]GAE07650.1 hypothetical protein JCM10914_3890 [Paenibacillus sp. JCM 10914]